ncbi:hypothetical protein Tco_0336355 [Tanacetum coccineum]
MCRQQLPQPLSPPPAKLMIMALEEYGYQSRRGIRVPKKWRSSYSGDILFKSVTSDAVTIFLTTSLDRLRRRRFMPAAPSPRSVNNTSSWIWGSSGNHILFTIPYFLLNVNYYFRPKPGSPLRIPFDTILGLVIPSFAQEKKLDKFEIGTVVVTFVDNTFEIVVVG